MVSHAQVPTQPRKENTSIKGKGSWKGTGKQTGLGISLAESLPGKKMDFFFPPLGSAILAGYESFPSDLPTLFH